MYLWNEESRRLMDDIRGYISEGKAIPGAPEGTQEKYDKIKAMLEEERKRQMAIM